MTGEMAVLDRSGDIKTVWDSENREEVAAAKKQFDDLGAKGFAAFRVKKGGEKGEQIRTFDPEAEAIIMVPQMVGG